MNDPKTIKLTKKSLNDFILWTTTKYNNYLGYGTKKEAILTAYHSLTKGYYVEAIVTKKGHVNLIEKPELKIVEFQCANPCGENRHQRLWRTKQGGEQYVVDCVSKTITAQKSNRILKFDSPETNPYA